MALLREPGIEEALLQLLSECSHQLHHSRPCKEERLQIKFVQVCIKVPQVPCCHRKCKCRSSTTDTRRVCISLMPLMKGISSKIIGTPLLWTVFTLLPANAFMRRYILIKHNHDNQKLSSENVCYWLRPEWLFVQVCALLWLWMCPQCELFGWLVHAALCSLTWWLWLWWWSTEEPCTDRSSSAARETKVWPSSHPYFSKWDTKYIWWDGSRRWEEKMSKPRAPWSI